MSNDLLDELRLIGCHANGDARCTCVIGQDAIARIEALTAERDALRKSATEARKQLRIIAGMDLIGASATAYNAARDLEAALSRKATP